MMGSTHSIHLVLGCAAVLAAASACSHPTPEPSSPSIGASPGRSTIQDQGPASTGGSNTAQPGFETERDTTGQAQPGTIQQPQPGAMPQGQMGSMPQGQMGSMPQAQPGATQPGGAPLPGSQGAGVGASPQAAPGSQPGSPGTSERAVQPLASINEREACELLMSEAMLHMEPIEGGVAIVAKPRRTSDVSTVRNRMQSIHRGIERGGPASTEVQCELFALGRNGVASLIETPDSIRLLVTTSDATRVPQLRRQANAFLRSKATPAQRGGPSQGGTPSGGTPQHSDETPQGNTP